MGFVQIGQLHSGIKSNFLFVYHIQQFRDKVGQADKTLDLLITFACSFSNNLCTAFPEIIWDNLSHIFGSSNSSFDCFQLHLVSESPFTGQNVLTLEIAVHHEQNSGIIIHLTDDNGQGIQPGKLCSVLAAVPGDDLIATTLAGPDDQRLRNADVFIYVGGESDAWVQTVLEGVDNPNLRVVTLMDCVELLHEETVEGMQAERHGHDHDEEDEDEEELDEHVWTSPRNAARICRKLCDTFSAADSAHAAQYAQRCGDYVEQLDRLDAEFQDVVENAARKTVVFADRFPLRYFADAYGLDYYAAYPGCADAAEPSAATVAFLIDKVRAEGIPVVFTIELSNGKLADTICEATGAKKLEFATCHNVTAQAFANGATYLQLMERNVQALREALN